MGTTLFCSDDTCKWNEDGVCKRAVLEMEITHDIHQNPIVACKCYEDKRNDGI